MRTVQMRKTRWLSGGLYYSLLFDRDKPVRWPRVLFFRRLALRQLGLGGGQDFLPDPLQLSPRLANLIYVKYAKVSWAYAK